MRVNLVAFTERGVELACRIADGLATRGDEVLVSAPERHAKGHEVRAYESLSAWTEEAFDSCDALVFVSACGIAVRSIAPFIQDKMSDPAVVCVDEGAQHAVSLLSGHVGGGNALTRSVALLCGARPVITTATDVNGTFAVDEWAVREGLVPFDREVAKEVSSRLLEGKTVGLQSDWPVEGTLPEGLIWDETAICDVGISISHDLGKNPFARTLRLVPRTVTVGMGCRRGTAANALAEALDATLAHARIAREAIARLASIDVKADEEGLVTLSDWLGVPFVTHSVEELSRIEGEFSSSKFVFQSVGIDNVCERAACAEGEHLLVGKRTFEGVTVALAASDPQLTFSKKETEEEGGELP